MTENELLRKRFNKAARTGDFLFRHYKNLEETAMQAEIAAKTCWLCGGPINTRPLTAKSVASVYLRADAEARLLAEIAAGETPTVSASDFLAICGGCMRKLTRTRQKAEEGVVPCYKNISSDNICKYYTLVEACLQRVYKSCC